MSPLSRKFDLKALEERILQWWDDENIYAQIRAREEDWPVWRFIDGPPYTTGSIHLGTAWNKILKDVLIRYKRMQGFRVTDTPGYDTHGLPIEVLMEKKLGIKDKQEILGYGMNKFIKKCQDHAEAMLLEMNEQFARLGCAFWAWDRPYITLKNSYIEGIWWTLKKAWEKGLLYQFYKPQNCCPRCSTALAKHEFDYQDIEDTSIYVKFRAVDWEDTWFVIWTTTPWTLVANEAIMANPLFDYIKAKVSFPDGREEFWILSLASATNLIMGELGLQFTIEERFKGEVLKGRKYVHPLAEEVPYQAELARQSDNVHSVIMTKEYVAEGEGVGLVHTAPGHGPEDFEVGVAHGIPVYNPVDLEGRYTAEAGAFEGKFVFDANAEIVELLKVKGTLVFEAPIKHEYAHCWRCHSKLVYRATKQWFFKTTALADDMLAENAEIYWVPDWAGNRWFDSWLRNLKDWCISRQRFWGIPLSVWVCDNEDCEETTVIGSSEELRAVAGDCPDDLHRPWIDAVTWPCPACGSGTMRRIPDILDVWLDSGSVMWAAQEAVDGTSDFEHWVPADFILEGKDQIRGWFNSLLCSAMVSSGRRNYDACYMHGWVTMGGKKLSKSSGTAITPGEIIAGTHAAQAKNRKWSKVKGIETFRFYSVGGAKPGLDLNFDWKEYTDTYRVLNTVWNTCLFLTGKLDLFAVTPDPDLLRAESLRAVDRWVLSRAHSTLKAVTAYLEAYELPTYPKLLRDFVVNDVSRWYIAINRDRVRDSTDPADRAEFLTVLAEVLWQFVLAAAPLNPMLAEALYVDVFKPLRGTAAASVHLLPWPEADTAWIDADLEAHMEFTEDLVEASRTLRAEAKIKLKWPLQRMVLVPKENWPGVEFEPLLKKLVKVETLEVAEQAPAGDEIVSLELGPAHVYLDLTMTSRLLVRRILNDLVRAIQYTRKLNKYEMADEISLVLVPSEVFVDELRGFHDKIAQKVSAKTVEVVPAPDRDFDGYDTGTVHFCPNEKCYAMIKAKHVTKARDANAPVKCFYCGQEMPLADLNQVAFYFQRD